MYSIHVWQFMCTDWPRPVETHIVSLDTVHCITLQSAVPYYFFYIVVWSLCPKPINLQVAPLVDIVTLLPLFSFHFISASSQNKNEGKSQARVLAVLIIKNKCPNLCTCTASKEAHFAPTACLPVPLLPPSPCPPSHTHTCIQFITCVHVTKVS